LSGAYVCACSARAVDLTIGRATEQNSLDPLTWNIRLQA